MDTSRTPVDGAPAHRVVGGRYRLIEPLGSGGMGTVWRAEDDVLGRPVAVKEVVFPHGLSEQDRATLRERTRREARAAARLHHPSVVTVYDVVEEDGQPWLVLELVEARTLAETVSTDGPLSPQRTALVGLAVLGALEAAHLRGIVHRDVKPSNVLLGVDRVVLTDFGIATSSGDSSITSTGLLLGSPSYISPERARGATPGPPSDLWSLGATLFTAVEGRAPYDKGEPVPTLTAVVTGDRAPYVAAGPLVPVLDGLLAQDPAHRLDAPRARSLLEAVATTAPTAVLVRPEPAPDAVARAERTSALPLAPPVVPTSGDGPRLVVPAVAPQRVPAAAPVPVRRRSRAPLAVAGAAALLLAGGAYGVASLGGDGGSSGAGTPAAGSSASPAPGSASPASSPGAGASTAPATGPTTRPSPSQASPTSQPSPTRQPSPSSSAAASPQALPGGLEAVTGPGGWVAGVPAGWRRSSYPGGLQFRDPDTGRTLRVTTGPGQPDAVADRERAATGFAVRHSAYQRIGITAVDYVGAVGADWEFTYRSGGTQLHVLDRVVAVGGTGHSLYFQTRAADWPAARADLERILGAFRPVGG